MYESIVVGSWDPNDKLATGFGEEGFIQQNTPLPYTVRFENLPTASAPAQMVVVTDTLDENLDLDTFELTEVEFANRIIQIPEGLVHFETTVDLRPEGTDAIAEIEIDLTTITTDRSQRDSRVQSALETSQFHLATFSLTSPVELPEGAATGESFRADAEGDLTVHGVTNPVTFGIEAQLVDAVVVVVGSAEIVFDDYGVTAPSAPVVLSVEDHGIVEFQLLFTR